MENYRKENQMNTKNISYILNAQRIATGGIDTNKYMKSRTKELVEKGYNKEKAIAMVVFELNLYKTIATVVTEETALECYETGAMIGADLLAPESFGLAATIGLAAGGFAGQQACKKIIDFASQKTVQQVSEHLWTQKTSPSALQVDLTYMKAQNAAKDLKPFNPAKAVKNISHSSEVSGDKVPLFKLSAEKTDSIFLPGGGVLSNQDEYGVFKDAASRYVEAPVTPSRNFIQRIRDEQDARRSRILDNLSGKTRTLTSKEYEFDEAADVRGYFNGAVQNNRIYTKEEIEEMVHEEFSVHERGISYQRERIGVPTREQADRHVSSGGMVFVNSYTRDDGVRVRSYYRARP